MCLNMSQLPSRMENKWYGETEGALFFQTKMKKKQSQEQAVIYIFKFKMTEEIKNQSQPLCGTDGLILKRIVLFG